MDEIETLLKEVLDRCETLEHIWGTEKIEEHNRLCRLVGGVFSRLMHSTGSAYEQDTSFAYGPLQLLKASAKALLENSPADWSLFYQTTFVRQRNRMVRSIWNSGMDRIALGFHEIATGEWKYEERDNKAGRCALHGRAYQNGRQDL